MFLTEKKSTFPSFSPFQTAGKRPPPIDYDSICTSFDESILRRLKPLAISTASSPAITLTWLSRAVEFVSTTHAEAQALISKITSGSHDDGSKAIYLDYSVKLLDICNAISSDLEKLRHRRLLMSLVVRLLQVSSESDIPAPEKLKKASDSITEWNSNKQAAPKRRGFENRDPEVLIRDLAAAIAKISPPRGKTTAVGKAVLRTIYAVGLVTIFVAGVAVSALHGVSEIVNIRVPSEFLWADSVNGLESSIFRGDRKVALTELADVATRATVVRDLIVAVDSGENIEAKKLPLANAVKELEASTSGFSEGLDRLSNGVSEMFRNVMSTRNVVLENFRVGQDEKQRK
ncbi:hypothetical protein DCAR_0726892 [Daucus carota subsp. sativus]|uniref:Uncharacterized protein n=1 Tax=Daucus carota subsp. sativus TaxID=79200 RepID=A0A164SLU2_DAUCS|nr:PREDICTED: protein BPS1, chloroplastic-like [Daucus carota subsp. sativus]WOH07462.1 hypothetical protein DCAR_0726892 [Daucus carota subsp. sativus]